MKKVVLASVLALAAITFCAVPLVRAQDITIKDPAELNTYQNAIGTADPKAKAAALEDFLTKYPQTVLKVQVLNLLLGTYQGLNDQPDMIKTAKRLLDSDPTNLRAAFAYVFLTKTQAQKAAAGGDAPGSQSMLDDAAKVAQAALKVTAPSTTSGVSAADFQKLKDATTPIFESAIAADDFGKKDYKDAIEDYKAELKSYPDLTAKQAVDAGAVNETYLLGQSYINEDPKDLVNGVFYLERAAQYAPAAAKDQVEKAAEYWYQKYHGGMDGFDAVKTLAHDNGTPPATYAITPAPPPPAPDFLAHQALYPPTGPPTDIKTMALGDKEYVLANGNQADADAVWATMKGTRVQVPGVVIQATADSVQLAVSTDAQQTKTADFTINFTKPLADVPAIGASVKYDATFDSYTKTPSMIILNDGAVPEAPKAPVHRKPAAHH